MAIDNPVLPYPHPAKPYTCHGCVHEKDPNFILGSVIRTLVVGSLVFITAFAFSELAKITFKWSTHNFDEYDPVCKQIKDEFNLALKYAIIVSLIAVVISFLVMFYIPGTKW